MAGSRPGRGLRQPRRLISRFEHFEGCLYTQRPPRCVREANLRPEPYLLTRSRASLTSTHFRRSLHDDPVVHSEVYETACSLRGIGQDSGCTTSGAPSGVRREPLAVLEVGRSQRCIGQGLGCAEGGVILRNVMIPGRNGGGLPRFLGCARGVPSTRGGRQEGEPGQAFRRGVNFGPGQVSVHFVSRSPHTGHPPRDTRTVSTGPVSREGCGASPGSARVQKDNQTGE